MRFFTTESGGTITVEGAIELETAGLTEISAQEKAVADVAANLPLLIKSECARRIFAVASANTQLNMAAAHAAGLLSAPQAVAFADGLAWIASMRATSKSLIATHDTSYASDEHWPTVPSNVADLAAEF